MMRVERRGKEWGWGGAGRMNSAGCWFFCVCARYGAIAATDLRLDFDLWHSRPGPLRLLQTRSRLAQRCHRMDPRKVVLCVCAGCGCTRRRRNKGDARGAGCDTAAAAAAGLAAGASATSCFAGRCEALGAAPVDESAPFFFGVRKRSVLDRQTDITESLEVSCFFLAVVSTNSSASMLLLNL
eukprot:1401-Rhodomonas_salina.1